MSEPLVINAATWVPGVIYLKGAMVNCGSDVYRALKDTTSHPYQANGDWRQINWRPS